MSRTTRAGLIQLSLPPFDEDARRDQLVEAMIRKHLPMIEKAGRNDVQILCLQEIFNTPYFCPSQDAAWFNTAEPIPGPTTERLAEYAARHQMVLIVPIYEKETAGVLYNSAAVIDADGSYLGKYRKTHIPHTSGFWEKFFFRPGNLGYPVFQTAYAKIGVYICYDRHFPEGARALGLGGAEIVFNPSATVNGLSEHLWQLEQPAHAVANGYLMGCVNRVGVEEPWRLGTFYGRSYFANPRGEIIAEAPENKDALLIADLDLDQIDEVRALWQFYRDRRPDAYDPLVAP